MCLSSYIVLFVAFTSIISGINYNDLLFFFSCSVWVHCVAAEYMCWFACFFLEVHILSYLKHWFLLIYIDYIIVVCSFKFMWLYGVIHCCILGIVCFFNAMMCLDLASAQQNENYYRRKMN
jgi:hypothetical protein